MAWFWKRRQDELEAPRKGAKPHSPSALSSEEPLSKFRSLLNAEDWSITASLVLASIALPLITRKVYRRYLGRFREAVDIPARSIRQRNLFGRVTSVGDGDDFRLFHTPGGRLAGWGWLRRVPDTKKALVHETVCSALVIYCEGAAWTNAAIQIHVRIAGVDAPEGGHFGRKPQPYAAESLAWLRNYLLGRQVRAHLYRHDQYGRVVGTVFVRRGLLRRDVGLQMLKAGCATIYEAKSGAEFGKSEAQYRQAEVDAKAAKRGMWAAEGHFESPMAYKARAKAAEEEQTSKSDGDSSGNRKKSWWSRWFGR